MNKFESFAVGQSAPQVEAQEKVSGTAQYIADLYRPNMLHGALLQSPHAHARILGYDVAQAAAMPGVHAIITGDDLQEPWRMGAFIKLYGRDNVVRLIERALAGEDLGKAA